MTTMHVQLPPELWIRISLCSPCSSLCDEHSEHDEHDEHTFNSLARAIPYFGRWTMGARDGVYDSSLIINRRLDLMLLFGYSVALEMSTETANECDRIVWTKNGRIHRNDLPAITVIDVPQCVDPSYPNAYTWCYHGRPHRVDGPAVAGNHSYYIWYRRGRQYRDYGPTEIRGVGLLCWSRNYKLHRTDGPAYLWSNGHMIWYDRGKIHRADGPADIRADGSRKFYIDGTLTFEMPGGLLLF